MVGVPPCAVRVLTKSKASDFVRARHIARRSKLATPKRSVRRSHPKSNGGDSFVDRRCWSLSRQVQQVQKNDNSTEMICFASIMITEDI
jgi:hypothetical protein